MKKLTKKQTDVGKPETLINQNQQNQVSKVKKTKFMLYMKMSSSKQKSSSIVRIRVWNDHFLPISDEV